MSSFDPYPLREQFPALTQTSNGRPTIFFDNPGGTQVPDAVIAATVNYYRESNANVGGTFATSRRTDAILRAAREGMADLLNAPGPENIVFGANMTSLTFHLARSIAETIVPGDEIIITNLDHDANVSPWTDMEANGAVIRVLDVQIDGTLDMSALAELISNRTRLVAVTHASNALGSIPDVAEVVRLAHSVGAWVYVDAVQFAPHGPIDVQALDCDFLACSAYKFFGPHVGVLYGKTEHLTNLKPHKVRPAKDTIPYRWETGTQNHEGLAGVAAAVGYLNGVGERFGGEFQTDYEALGYVGRRLTLKTAMQAIREYEKTLSAHLLEGLSHFSELTCYGITDRTRLEERLPTVVFTWSRATPLETATYLAEHSINCLSGNYYALRLMERLGLEGHGGAVRVGLTHYNSHEEIDTFLTVLSGMCR